MKLALIPPRGWERFALRSDFHLALAQVSNNFYTHAYLEASHRGDHIIVDNGAAEGTPVGDYKLFYQAQQWNANEVVLPDVMFDGEATVERALQFVRNIEDSAYILNRFSYMAVAQGKTVTEVRQCISKLADNAIVKVIGIPRHLIHTIGLRYIRLSLAEWIERQHPNRFKLHLLGTHPSVPGEVRKAAQDVPFIRSVDTSMPFNYAIANTVLFEHATPVTRPNGYLTELQTINTAILNRNIETMKRWAAGNE